MFVNIYKIKKKCIAFSQPVTYLWEIFEKKQIHTTPKEGPWSVLFFGTDDFSLQSLERLNEEYKSKALSRLEVVTTPYKGKNKVLTYATENKITINTWPVTFNITNFHIGIVVSFGHLIPEHIINSFPFGIWNIHGSLLPKWRGATPIEHSIINGDTHTGVTLMNVLPKKFDIGEIIAQDQTSIGPDETAPELRARLAKMGADLLVETLNKLPSVLSEKRLQSQKEVTYAPKLTPKMCLIIWDKMSATDIYNLQRGLAGFRPLVTKLEDMNVKLLGIRKIQKPSNVSDVEQNIPGIVTYDKVNNVLIVRCKDDSWISVEEVSIPGRRVIKANDFNNGFLSGRKQKIVVFQ